MEAYNKKKENINVLLLVIYLYLSTLTLPIKTITDSGIVVWVLTGLILFVSLYNNKLRINKKVFYILLSIILLFLINILLVNFFEPIFNIFIEFLKFGVIPLYLASFIKNYNILLKKWYLFAIISTIIWLVFLSDVNSRSLNYMTFGRHMTLSLIVFTIYYYTKGKKVINLVLMFICLMVIGFFANRSSLLIALTIISFFELKSLRSKNVLLSYFKSIIYIIFIAVLIIRLEDLVYWLREYLQSIGINSYFLTKAVFAFRSGISESLSGRDDITDQAINLITSNNFMPNGIGYFQYVTGIVYPHNIILDILVSFGFFGLILLFVFIVFAIRKYIKIKDMYFKILIVPLSIYLLIRLSFSGTFWSEEELWMLVGLFTSYSIQESTQKKRIAN